MYRAYKQTCLISLPKEESQTKDKEDDYDENSADEIQREVYRLWRDVEKQCQDRETTLTGVDVAETEEMLDWNTVRVFVSSTFTDFFSEREVLVKKVFPELREWCQDHGLKLLECDLRWGIPKDTSTADTILVCLDEIEKCRDINKGKPFFINLIGERYGWIPSVDETPDEAREKYGWIEGSSITFMEILHGAYRETNPNAAFFMRDEAVLSDIPESFLSRFRDDEPLAKLHLKTMKQKIYQRFPGQVFPYECKFRQVSSATGREQVELSELEEFAEMVINFLKSAIQRTYPQPKLMESEADVQKREQDRHWMYAVDKAKSLIGRQSELEILKEFVENGQTSHLEKAESSGGSVRLESEWSLQESDSHVCVLEGCSGWGKTALMCKLIVDTARSGLKVFYHVVNSSSGSNSVESLLTRLLHVLIPQPDDNEKQVLESSNIEDLKKLLNTALVKYRDSCQDKLVIILDGLNELENSETYPHLSWLPPVFPHNIHCIVSTNDHPPTTARLYEHPAFKMTLQHMTAQDLMVLAVRYLESFNKKLDSSELERLVSNTGVDNPLWMMIMVEELRVFGDFRALKEKIDKFPNTMEGLLIHIIDRLILEDDENGVIKKILCLTACSRYGLPSENVLKICGNIESKVELAPLHWARANRSLKPYLRGYGRIEEVITFSHEAVLKAVSSHLLASQHELSQWHTVLADFYQFWCDDPRAKVFHLPHHLKAANLKKRLLEFMRQDRDSYTHINSWMRSSLMKDARCRLMVNETMAGIADLKLCLSCSFRTQGYNPACNWPNKQCCVICGTLCMGPKTTGARACMRHAFQASRKCVLCNFMVGPSDTPAQLCLHCGFGHGEKTCACFDV